MFTQALGVGTPGASSGWLGDFRFEADIQGLNTAPTARHPDANIILVANSSYKRLRELVAGYGYTQFCTRGTTTALPTTAVETGETYASITTLVGMDQLKMVDVKDTNGRWRPGGLPEVTLLQLRDFATPFSGAPRAWCWLDSGSVSGATFTGGKIAITPVPIGGSYALWTMSEPQVVASSTDVFLYHTEDWRMWHMYDVMSRIVGARDKDTAKKLQFIMSRLDPSVEGSPAFNIKNQAPTASGSKTMTRSSNYNGIGPWGGR